jgi:translation initiation factor IF-3
LAIKGRLYLKVNQEIRSPELRVIGSDGKQIGLLSRDEALNKAREEGLDLIEIAPTARPPVAKIIDQGKFRYELEKKLQKEKKKTKASELKEVRFSPFIAENDFNTRTERVREFLEGKNKVRLVVVFLGRQMNSKSFGYDVIKRVMSKFEGSITLDSEPKFFGRHLAAIISPTKKLKGERQELKEEV